MLPDSVANQIAAGEVVQRPSSIIKEMVENSLDAGAERIQVLIVDGGKTNVQVIDDGKGMSETDARLSFERHATSKIKNASDLFNLSTMGFRGEALASIAAVAQVELKTRRPEDELGTLLEISGSKIERQEPVQCPVGSNFSVKNLFFNVPARRKFLKSNQTELTNVVSDFHRIVLVHPEVSFTLYNNGAEMYSLPKSSLRQRIVDVFGKKINAELLPIEVETSLVSISGYVGKPESSRKKGSHQYFFVNGRFMRHPYFHSAVMKAYDNLIPIGEHVSYFIYFSVEPSTIDVNVHPTKTEIKFDNEQPIWQVLSATVRETIGKFSNVPMIDFDVEGRPDIPVIGADDSSLPVMPRLSAPSYNPFSGGSNSNKYSRSEGWEMLYESSEKKIEKSEGWGQGDDDVLNGLFPSGAFSNTENLQRSLWDEVPSNDMVVGEDFTSYPKFQYKGQYIIVPSKLGLLAVDQHRAHVRVLFEQNMHCLKESKRPAQKVLFPEIVQFNKNEIVALDSFMDDFYALGFELDNLGGGSYSVSGVPIGIEGVDVDSLLHEMLLSAMEKGIGLKEESTEALALTMAKKSAIVRGQVLSAVEMNSLLCDLFALATPARTPDGKVVYSVLDPNGIDTLF